jgi:hypothetical protein
MRQNLRVNAHSAGAAEKQIIINQFGAIVITLSTQD